jgi:hypothetical protein
MDASKPPGQSRHNQSNQGSDGCGVGNKLANGNELINYSGDYLVKHVSHCTDIIRPLTRPAGRQVTFEVRNAVLGVELML